MNALLSSGGADAAFGPALGDPLPAHVLPVGTSLGDFRVLGLIGEGGAGIVYRADQPPSRRLCAVKEYLPALLASRVAGTARVAPKSAAHAAAFQAGRHRFLEEARLLMRFNHPALAKVLARWEANGTAYQAMPVYEGPTLAQALARRGRPVGEPELLGWLLPLLDALRMLHAQQCLHRDITPWNIVLTERGPVLLDLGGPGSGPPAPAFADDRAAAQTVPMTRAYAALEMQGRSPSSGQGPWSDLYALAAVAYGALTGHPPPPAAERVVEDRMPPLSRVAGPGYGAPLLAALDAALAVRPEQRPRSVADFLQRLEGGAAPPEPPFLRERRMPSPSLPAVPESVPAAEAPPSMADESEASPAASAGSQGRRVVLAVAAAALFTAALLWLWPADRAAAPPAVAVPAPAAPSTEAIATAAPPRSEPPTPVEPPPAVAAPSAAPVEAAPSAAGDTSVPSASTPPAASSAPPPAADSTVPATPAADAPPRARAAPPRERPEPRPQRGGEVRLSASRACTDLLARASVEPLSARQLNFVVKECKG